MTTPDKIKKFYNSKAWRKTRYTVLLRDRGMCRNCGKSGKEVHHIKPINMANIDDTNISLNPDNLELLCTSCHDSKRGLSSELRFDVLFDDKGDLIKKIM